MTEIEYRKNVKKLKQKHNAAIKDLDLNFAKSNAEYKVGEIIKDYYHIIKIESITYYGWDYFKKLPGSLYKGVELKEDLTPRVNQNEPYMYSQNVIKRVARKGTE